MLFEVWSKIRIPGYIMVIVILVMVFLDTYAFYYSPQIEKMITGPYASLAIIFSVLSIIFIELDLLFGALGLSLAPNNVIKRLKKIYTPLESALRHPDWRKNKTYRQVIVRDMCAEVKEEWWGKSSYRPFLSILLFFCALLLVITFFSLISMNLTYALNYHAFQNIELKTPWLEHFYATVQTMFLIGADTQFPIHTYAYILNIFEILIGLLSIGIVIGRVVTPSGEELDHFLRTIKLYLL